MQLNLVFHLDFETIPHSQCVWFWFGFFYMLRSYFIYPFTESVVVSIFLSIDKKVSVAILEIKYYCILAYLTKMSWEKISVQGSTCVGKRLLDLAS